MKELATSESSVIVGGLTLRVDAGCEISDLRTEEQCANIKAVPGKGNTPAMAAAPGLLVVLVTLIINM